jgi:spore germination protein YaaH
MVALISQSISRNKLILGIPTYGYEYTVTPRGDGTYSYKRLWAFNPKYATDIAAQLSITPQRTSAGEIGFSYDAAVLAAIAPQGDDSTQTQTQQTPSTTVAQNAGSQVNFNQPFNYLSWSDAQAIEDKVELAHRMGLRGVAVFKFDGGEDPGMWEVLK